MAEAEDDEKALESLGRILRCLGRHSFDLEDRSEEAIEKEFERWAMHVLVGSPTRDEDLNAEEGTIRRDWGELTKFVNGHRQQEKRYVDRNSQDVRNVLWEFTNTVGRAMVEDQQTDQQVENYLGQLRSATEGGSFNEVKQALLSVVQGMNVVIDERKKRQQQRIKQLGEPIPLIPDLPVELATGAALGGGLDEQPALIFSGLGLTDTTPPAEGKTGELEPPTASDVEVTETAPQDA